MEAFVRGKPAEQCQYPGLREHCVVADDLAIDYDLPVAMRDGVMIRADLYRPARVNDRFCPPWFCGPHDVSRGVGGTSWDEWMRMPNGLPD